MNNELERTNEVEITCTRDIEDITAEILEAKRAGGEAILTIGRGLIEAKCRKCRYRSSTPEINGCDYILIVKRRRGCKPGKDCARFERGPRIAWWDKLPGPAPARTLEDREFNDYLSDVIGRQGAPVITKRRVML